MSGDRQKMGAYAPPPEDYSTFDAREAENERRGPILLIAFVVVASLFGAVVWNAYHLGVRDRNDPPVIETAGDYRQAPDDPGGYQTPGQDIDVYGLTSPEESGETAEAEQVTNTGTDTPEQSGTDSAPVNETRSEPEPAEVEDDTTATETMTDLVESVTDQPARQAEVEADDELIMPGPDTTQVDASQPEPVTEPETQTVTRPASTEGNFVVQIAAFRSREEAEDGWLSFAGRFPDMASGHAPDIVRVDLGARGIYHRLRIAAFSTRDEASAFCSSLSGRGQDCLVASR